MSTRYPWGLLPPPSPSPPQRSPRRPRCPGTLAGSLFGLDNGSAAGCASGARATATGAGRQTENCGAFACHRSAQGSGSESRHQFGRARAVGGEADGVPRSLARRWDRSVGCSSWGYAWRIVGTGLSWTGSPSRRLRARPVRFMQKFTEAKARIRPFRNTERVRGVWTSTRRLGSDFAVAVVVAVVAGQIRSVRQPRFDYGGTLTMATAAAR